MVELGGFMEIVCGNYGVVAQMGGMEADARVARVEQLKVMAT